MGKLIGAEDGAAKLGITSRRLRALCAERRVAGARRVAGRWFVPETISAKDIAPGTRGPKREVNQ